ncbi:flagellar hook 2 domain-containing protein [Massilia violaceinigra]|uniref:Flagellar hook-associated protein 2 n=1 Tax=Massilia violaceinigra TaxID=2045208 RepID=A0A2D2DSK2_9BURK|nr:flagellar filament capping protein FliD [Massilia violaceinigra]ATQ77954.1 flagellar hook 2 domain-containing protein [Massilia violaceinigra]
MALPITSNNVLNGLNAGNATSAEMYGRVSKTLLAQNPSIQKLTGQLTRNQTRLSGLGQLQSALASFQSLAQSLSGAGLQTGATSSSPNVLTALTMTGAKTGSYAIDVQQLAQSQTLLARPQKEKDTVIGSGAATAIKVEFGSESGNAFTPNGSVRSITIDSGNNTLQGMADAFKAAGIDATIVKSSAGYALKLTGPEGAAGSMRISAGGDAAVEKLLAYNPAGLKNLTAGSSAQDAVLNIDGKRVTSSSNVITGQIGGTALALTGKGSSKVVVAQENGAITKNIGNFIDGFNKVSSTLQTLQQGGLKSDPALRQAQDQLTSMMRSNSAALEKAGITLDKNGSLKVDAKALEAAVLADPGAVSKLFTDGGNGIADKLDAQLAQLLGAGSSISKEKLTIDRGIANLASQKTTLTNALAAQATNLVARYTDISQGGGANSGLPGLPGGGAKSLFDFMA